MPFQSIAWATDLAFVLLIFLLYSALQRDVGKLDAAGSWLTLGKSLVAAAVMGAATFGMAALLPPHAHKIMVAAAFVLIFLVSAWIYVWITGRIKMPEIEYVDRAMARLSATTGVGFFA